MLETLKDSDWSYDKAAHLMSRANMASTRDETIALYELGRDQGVEAAVDSIVGAPDDWDNFPFPTWWDGKNVDTGPADSVTDSGDQFVQWYSKQLLEANPLGAKMFKFLVDHAPINSSLLIQQHRYIYLFQHFDLCRKHALGNFKSFIEKISWDGGMIWMLDLKNSVRGNLNENFGRELLELFTLGVDGGYTEEDVVACSRAFTGRSTPTRKPEDWPYSPFLNDHQWPPQDWKDHYYLYIDTDEKTFLGETLTGFTPDDEEEERMDHGPDVLDVIFRQPACGEYLVWKLWRYFVAPDPPEVLVHELGERFRTVHNYELRPLLKDIFMCEAFFAQENIGNQIKDAGDYLVSCVKALGVGLPSPRVTYLTLESMGYNAMLPPSIAGWPEPEGEGNGWLGADKTLFRVNLPLLWLEKTFVMFDRSGGSTPRNLYSEEPPSDFRLDRVAPGQFRERRNIDLLLNELNDRLLPFHRLSSQQRDFLIENDERNYRELDKESRIRELIRMIMALPEFQLQ
ncbi:DUF1800 domain-containing protein [Akkermansiaceae bacterium]|nr:DUF1800 domain-containing protein [Akkermansiaceae bacterium]MDB4544921.1 DUF1800 domain-containing protein [Akkermansiaceae bacterium]